MTRSERLSAGSRLLFRPARQRRFFVPREIMRRSRRLTTPLVDVMLVLLIMFIIIIRWSATRSRSIFPPARRLSGCRRRPTGSTSCRRRPSWDGAAIAPRPARRLAALAGDPRPRASLNAEGEPATNRSTRSSPRSAPALPAWAWSTMAVRVRDRALGGRKGRFARGAEARRRVSPEPERVTPPHSREIKAVCDPMDRSTAPGY
jgi:hypothetical protein